MNVQVNEGQIVYASKSEHCYSITKLLSDEQVVLTNTDGPKCHQEVTAVHAVCQRATYPCHPH